MDGRTNMSGVQEQTGGGGSCPLPDEGEYFVEITLVKDGFSKAGDPMPSIKLRIVSGPFQNSWVWDNILIPDANSPAAKILGRTKHFLHCIGEPYDGDDLAWYTERWLYKPCKIRIEHEAPNDYHKKIKPIVAEYIIEDEIAGDDSPI